MTIVYNKNKVMLLVIFLLAAFHYTPRLYKVITYSPTSGVVARIEYEVEKINTGNGTSKIEYDVPVILFYHNDRKYYCRAGTFLLGVNKIGDKVPVRFNPKDPNKAFVNTFLGYWMYPLLTIFPVIVIMSGFVLVVEMRLKRRKNKSFTDSGITLRLDS